VIDLGLRLDDIGGLGRELAYDKGNRSNKIYNLRENGATEEEIQILLNERIELNAMTSDQLIAFVERKLAQHGIKKVVPDGERLAETYRLVGRTDRIKKIVEAELAMFEDETDEVPDNSRLVSLTSWPRSPRSGGSTPSTRLSRNVPAPAMHSRNTEPAVGSGGLS